MGNVIRNELKRGKSKKLCVCHVTPYDVSSNYNDLLYSIFLASFPTLTLKNLPKKLNLSVDIIMVVTKSVFKSDRGIFELLMEFKLLNVYSRRNIIINQPSYIKHKI